MWGDLLVRQERMQTHTYRFWRDSGELNYTASWQEIMNSDTNATLVMQSINPSADSYARSAPITGRHSNQNQYLRLWKQRGYIEALASRHLD
jgi:hypothetical protein